MYTSRTCGVAWGTQFAIKMSVLRTLTTHNAELKNIIYIFRSR
jgi:hypothetical protein